jgi:hypothetical protein
MKTKIGTLAALAMFYGILVLGLWYAGLLLSRPESTWAETTRWSRLWLPLAFIASGVLWFRRYRSWRARRVPGGADDFPIRKT